MKGEDIEKLIKDLGRARGAATRRRARERLATMGRDALPCLLKCLQDPDEGVRWEAAKLLRNLDDPAAIAPLIEALEDRNFSVQWLAADGLVALGRRSLIPLLEALAKEPESESLRQGAHHVLSELARRGLLGPAPRRLIKALYEHYGHSLVGPYAAEALRALKKRKL